MSNIPEDLKYALTHEWIRLDDSGIATIGISDHAQDALGDIVFIELPEPGTTVNAKEEIAVIESIKAASDIYSPITGKIIEINETLLQSPETVNTSPYENAWLFKMRVNNEFELDDLMDCNAYSDHCNNE